MESFGKVMKILDTQRYTNLPYTFLNQLNGVNGIGVCYSYNWVSNVVKMTSHVDVRVEPYEGWQARENAISVWNLAVLSNFVNVYIETCQKISKPVCRAVCSRKQVTLVSQIWEKLDFFTLNSVPIFGNLTSLVKTYPEPCS